MVPFRVFGHPRSGNHLLASVLQVSLLPDLEPVTLPKSARVHGHWANRETDSVYCVDGVEQPEDLSIPYGQLMGYHRFPYKALDLRRVVYVVRDGRDVACSIYRWKAFRRKDQQELTLDEYLRQPLDWRARPANRCDPRPGYVLFDHWRDHVSAWLAKNVLWVRYENLLREPDIVVRRVARHFGLPVLVPPALPRGVGWNPSDDAHVSKWRSSLSRDARALFDRKVLKSHPGRWDP